MPAPKAYFQMASYGDALYVFAGWNGAEVRTVERYSKEKGWVSLAQAPYVNHRYFILFLIGWPLSKLLFESTLILGIVQ